MKLLLYFLLFLTGASQTSNLQTTRTYKFEYSSNGNEGQIDYIQLVFKKDSVTGGKYYGNENNIHFVADIEFNENTKDNFLSFELNNFMFCDKDSNPYQKIECLQKDNPAFDVIDIPYFAGSFSWAQLTLRRGFAYYSGRFDKMTFILVGEN